MNCRQIQFCTCPDQIDLYQLRELLESTVFWAKKRRPEELAMAIANSEPVVTVWDKEKMIGFARATSDGIYRATIWDVVIHPDYRGIGLGQKLVETVLSHPRMNRVERVYLMATYQQNFFEQIGFQLNFSATMVLCDRSVNNSRLPIATEVS